MRPLRPYVSTLALMDSGEIELWSRARTGVLRSGVEAGRLVRPRNGVYVPVSAARDPGLHLAVAEHIAGADGALSHPTAAWLLHFPGQWPAAPVHVSVPRPRHPRSSPGITLHSPRTLRRRDVVLVSGRRCTSVARTVIDLAADGLRGDALLSLLCELYRLRRLTRQQLQDCMERAGEGLGTRRVRAVDEELLPGFHALAEVRFAREVRRTDMPQPQWQVPVRTSRGLRIIDALWHPLAVELKGRFHATDLGVWHDDMLREDELARLGLQLLSIPSKLALEDPAAAVARVVQRLRHVQLS